LFAKNPIGYEVESDAMVATAGIKAIGKIQFASTGPVNGETFTLAWGDNSVEFTFATSPSADSSVQLRVKGADSLAVFVAALVAYFERNYLVFEDFVITYDNSGATEKIIFTAREVGVDYTTGFTGAPTNVTFPAGTAGVDQTLQDNAKIKSEVWLEENFDADDFIKILDADHSPVPDDDLSQDASIKVDVMDVINRYLKKDFQLDFPAVDLDSTYACQYIMRKFYLRFGERYGDPIDTKRMWPTKTGYAFLGGIPEEEFPTHTRFETLVQGDGIWLTNGPTTRSVTNTQRAYLNFMLPYGTSGMLGVVFDYTEGLMLKLNVYFDDDTTVEEFTTPDVTNYSKFQILTFPLDYDSLGINAIEIAESKTAVRYDVTVYLDQAGAGDISETLRFDLAEEGEDDREFIFWNAIGGPDFLRTTGMGKKMLDAQKQLAERIIHYDYTIMEARKFVFVSRAENAWNVNVGMRDEEEMEWLQELLSSIYVVEIVDEEYIPVVVKEGQEMDPVNEDRATIRAFEFEYLRAFKTNL